MIPIILGFAMPTNIGNLPDISKDLQRDGYPAKLFRWNTVQEIIDYCRENQITVWELALTHSYGTGTGFWALEKLLAEVTCKHFISVDGVARTKWDKPSLISVTDKPCLFAPSNIENLHIYRQYEGPLGIIQGHDVSYDSEVTKCPTYEVLSARHIQIARMNVIRAKVNELLGSNI